MNVNFENIQAHIGGLYRAIIQDRDWPNSFGAIIAVGGGGFIPGRMLRAYFPNAKLIGVSVERYVSVDSFSTVFDVPRIIQWISPKSEAADLIRNTNVLVVDECFDEGKTLNFVTQKLLHDRLVQKHMVFSAVIHKKRREGQVEPAIPLIYAEETDNVWITYPWDIRAPGWSSARDTA